jgi:ascorbate-specific PTS system EIIC-type component UlaA
MVSDNKEILRMMTTTTTTTMMMMMIIIIIIIIIILRLAQIENTEQLQNYTVEIWIVSGS